MQSAGGDAEKVFHLIPLTPEMLEMGRFALMDTMEDIILNFVGGLIMYVVLCIWPYRHKGKNDINLKIEAQTRETETANN